MWTEGRIEVRGITFHYWVKVYDEGSVYGINEGRISKLTIRNEKCLPSCFALQEGR